MTVEEQVEAVNNMIYETSEWLYDDGEDASLEEYQARHREFEDLVEPIFHRLEEAEGRDELVTTVYTALADLTSLMDQWAVEKPQVRATCPLPATSHPP